MTHIELTLPDLGWSNHFQSQLSIDELETHRALRVTQVHRNAVETLAPDGPGHLPMTADLARGHVAVGDWLLVAPNGKALILDRKSVIHRRAAGSEPLPQTIAANIDTLFITTSCNADFNLARLERYLALARQSGIEPVLLLTKADTADDPADFRRMAEHGLKGMLAETLDATDSDQVTRILAPWCRAGQTLALVGSSGVGKTTLVNALTDAGATTQAIREGDARGRHTTTARAMHALPAGGWLIDTPGMRELRLYDVGDGIDAVFADIGALAESCRFRDCRHQTEPGCAVQAAIETGALDPQRLLRWRKLQREDRHNSESVAQARARSRKLGKLHAHGKKRGEIRRGDA